MNKVSLTISGLVISVLSFVLPKIGISVLESDLAITITTITVIIGGICIYVGRVRQGDITIFGVKKKVKPTLPTE